MNKILIIALGIISINLFSLKVNGQVDSSLSLDFEKLERKEKRLSELYKDSVITIWACNSDKAIHDLSSGNVILMLPGSIGCPPPSKKDLIFQKKYGLTYSCPGCNRTEKDNISGYNSVIFNYLDKKHGKGWRKGVRKDVIGL